MKNNMILEVEVLYSETIKPSSPTPDHLHNYKLSFLDQLMPPIFMPLNLFYPELDTNTTKLTNTDKSNHLKNSLSEALTLFYPLAGRIIDHQYINCNDEGVPYVSAQVNCDLSDVLCDLNPNELNKLLPYELDDIRDLPMVIQLNFFNCGGIVVSIGLCHKVADALSVFMFINTWAAISRGDSDSDIPRPKFESANLFPPRNISGFKPSTGIVKDNIMTKRFIFSSSNIDVIRDKYMDNTSVEYPKRPTRIEALSAFVWNRYMASTQAANEEEEDSSMTNKIYVAVHAVNLRSRTDPPLTEHYFGNISRHTIAVLPSVEISEGEGYVIVNKMRDAIREINGDFVRELQKGDDNHFNDIKNLMTQFNKGEVVSFGFTSLCRFPMYEADFGWGKPIRVGSARLTFKNLVTFMDTITGDGTGGIEAWINLKEEDMAKFEVDKELLSFVNSPTTDAKTTGV